MEIQFRSTLVWQNFTNPKWDESNVKQRNNRRMYDKNSTLTSK